MYAREKERLPVSGLRFLLYNEISEIHATNTVCALLAERSEAIPAAVGVHFGPWSLRTLVTSVLRPNWTSNSVLDHFGPWSLRS